MKPYIVTDSTADFPKGFQVDDFAIMQMRYMLDDEEFDGVEKKLTATQFYERMKAGAKSNTSMIDEATLRGTIEPLLKEGRETRRASPRICAENTPAQNSRWSTASTRA